MNSSFRFFVSTDLRVGEGVSGRLGDFLAELDYNKVAFIVDKNVVNNTQIEVIFKSLKEKAISFDLYVSDSVEPTYDYLESFKLNFLAKGYQCLVGIGGGSILDLTKGIATLVTNEGEAITFRGFPKLKNRPLPVIAIPTTTGTGSEVTYNAVFTDSKEKKKLGINSTLNFPVLAIIDPLLTINCPKNVIASSGADALVHTLESFVHRNHTYLSRIFSREAFKLLFNGLWKISEGKKTLQIMQNIALGAYLAGIALINSGSGPSGALSYPLGAVYKVPHGYAGAIFLPHITKFNVDRKYYDYAELYDLIDGTRLDLSIEEKNYQFVELLFDLLNKLEIPQKLSSFGLKKEDLNFMIDQYDSLKAAINQNPIKMEKTDIKNIIETLA